MYAQADLVHAVAIGGRRTRFDLILPDQPREGEPVTSYGTQLG